MTCSSVSTNKPRHSTGTKLLPLPSREWCRGPRRGGSLALCLLLAVTGCGKKAALWLGTPRSGSVDLSRLAPRNPAWSNVVFYDKMIASLPPITVSADWTGSKTAALPAVASLGETKTDLALAQERTRLDLVKRREVTELTQRLAEARQYRLRVEGFAWRREQRATPQPQAGASREVAKRSTCSASSESSG